MTETLETFQPKPQAELCAGAPKRLRVSWSKLKAWESCHMRGKLASEGKRARIFDGRAFLPGTLADRCMRRWLEDGLKDRSSLQPGGMLRYLEEEFKTHTSKDAQYVIKWRGNPIDDQKAMLKDVVDALNIMEPILMSKVVPFDYQPEYRFVSVVGIPGPTGETVQVEIMGAVDVAVCMTPGHWEGQEWINPEYGLYDLKITRNDDYIKSTLGQLTFYDLAFHGWMGFQPVEHQFWAPLTKEVIIGTDVTEDERNAMVSRIIRYCEGVWSGDATLTEDKDECFHCQVKHACPRFAPRITKDQQGRNRVSFSTLGP